MAADRAGGDRRAVLGAVGAAVVAGAVGGGPAAEAAPAKGDGGTARGSFTVVDRRGRQRFRADSGKPPSIINGRRYPRHGPDNGTYLIFNDENGSEKGGIVHGSQGGAVTLDYPNADAVHLETGWEGGSGGAQLWFSHMPDPALPPDKAKPPRAVELFTATGEGTALHRNDSQGRPRIVLAVDARDRPTITVLDATGKAVTTLP